MYVVSNALLSQAEIEQVGHWSMGPMELLFIDVDDLELRRYEWVGLIAEWNRNYQGGYIRDGETLEKLGELLPGFPGVETPNLFLVPRLNGISELDSLLASLVPSSVLKRHGIDHKPSANMWLLPVCNEKLPIDFAQRCHRAFEEHLWNTIAPSTRHSKSAYRNDSSIRLLASDVRFWMSRIFRVALDIWEGFPVTELEEEHWAPIEQIKAKVAAQIPGIEDGKLLVRRPRTGGTLWDHHDDDECEAILSEAIYGSNILDPVDHVFDLLFRNGDHDDFSARYSWVKEDFERSFYSKRAKLKVTLVETVDDFPAWNHHEPEGYDNILFRDVMAMLNVNEQHLVVALRHGKSACDIADELGYASHSVISRAVKRLKSKVARILDLEPKCHHTSLAAEVFSAPPRESQSSEPMS